MTARLYTFAGTVFAAGLYFLWRTLQLPGNEAVSTLIGPRFWPLAILLVLLPLVVLLAVLVWQRGPSHFDQAHEMGEAAETAAERERESDWTPTRWQRGRHVVVLVLTIAYTVAMMWIGYLLATAGYAFLMSAALGEKRPLVLGLTTLGATALVGIVFYRLLGIPLP